MITIEEHREVPNLETFYTAVYIEGTIQNCSCKNGERLILFWQNFLLMLQCQGTGSTYQNSFPLSTNSRSFMIRVVTYSDVQRSIIRHVWCSSMYQWSWRMRNAGFWQDRLHCLLLLFTTNERGICISHKERLPFVLQIMYHTTCITVLWHV